MKFISALIFLASVILVQTQALADAPSASVDVALVPAGSFVGKTQDVKGEATLDGDTVRAENIIVNLKDLKTGVKLRDEHTQKHLETDKFPQAILVKAVGKGGKGGAIIKIKGVDEKVSGTYKIEGSTLIADFPVKLSVHQITGIKYMGIGVDDQVKIHVEIPIKKK